MWTVRLGAAVAVGMLAIAPAGTARAQTECRLCADPSVQDKRTSVPDAPLSVEISMNLDFSRAAIANGASGAVEIDPQSGRRILSGALVDLGGFGVSGAATVRGAPGRAVRVDMPQRVTLSARNGGEVTLVNIETDLPAAPRLDSNGRLSFSFGGRLQVDGGASGDFRGRIPITAQYE